MGKNKHFTLHTTHAHLQTPLDLHYPRLQPIADSVADCQATTANINKNKNYRGPAITCVSDNNTISLFSSARYRHCFSYVLERDASTIMFLGCGALQLVAFPLLDANTHAPSLTAPHPPLFTFFFLSFRLI